MKQAQQNAVENMMDETHCRDRGRGQSGAGMVMGADDRASTTCVGHRPMVMDDKEMFEDLLAAAQNDAACRRGDHAEKMAGFTSGLNLPPGMKLPPDDKPFRRRDHPMVVTRYFPPRKGSVAPEFRRTDRILALPASQNLPSDGATICSSAIRKAPRDLPPRSHMR